LTRIGVALALAVGMVALGVGAYWGTEPEHESAPAAEGAATLGLQRVATGLDSPLHVAAPRSERGRIYIVEQVGRIRVLEGGRLRAEPFLDIRNLVQSGGEQGLLSVAFHPSYARNRRFYVQYTDTNEDTRIVEYRSNGRRALPGTRRQIFFQRDPYGNHNGGQLVFGPDGKLYASVGDGGAGGDPENRAQNRASLFGKLFTIDVNRRGSRPQIVAIGLRNPWRFSFDRANGDLYIGDVGQSSTEEIDYTPRNSPGLENYGWDLYEGTQRFEDNRSGGGRLVFPIAEYGRSQGYSVTGGFVYRGTAIPALRGRYLYGDYGSGIIWSLRVVGGKATENRREAIRVDSLSSFGEDAAGELYATSLDEGTVYRITR
jgi:glucose/arabinose dehydrogenase